jgi:hypothetical protein
MVDDPIPTELRARALVRKTGAERFHENDIPIGANLLGYWQCSASDLLGNTERGRLAEYIVATAVGVADGVRSGWEPYDVETWSRIRVEVKASAYVQTWGQKTLSKIIFGIRPTRAWDADANVFAHESLRQANVYVFALLTERDKAIVNPLNVAQWQFYILRAQTLDERVPLQKTISLSSLLKLGALKVSYRELRGAIGAAWPATSAKADRR